jgi:hypothetical protein
VVSCEVLDVNEILGEIANGELPEEEVEEARHALREKSLRPFPTPFIRVPFRLLHALIVVPSANNSKCHHITVPEGGFWV